MGTGGGPLFVALVPLIRLAAGNKYMCVKLPASLSQLIDGPSAHRIDTPNQTFPLPTALCDLTIPIRDTRISPLATSQPPKMASHHDEDTMPEETQGYKLSQPKQSIAEYQQMGMSINTSQKPPTLLRGTRRPIAST